MKSFDCPITRNGRTRHDFIKIFHILLLYNAPTLLRCRLLSMDIANYLTMCNYWPSVNYQKKRKKKERLKKKIRLEWITTDRTQLIIEWTRDWKSINVPNESRFNSFLMAFSRWWYANRSHWLWLLLKFHDYLLVVCVSFCGSSQRNFTHFMVLHK